MKESVSQNKASTSVVGILLRFSSLLLLQSDPQEVRSLRAK